MLARVRTIRMAVTLHHLALGIWGVIFGQCRLSPREKKILFHEKKKPKQANFVFTGKNISILVEHQNDGVGCPWLHFFCLKIFWGPHLEILQYSTHL